MTRFPKTLASQADALVPIIRRDPVKAAQSRITRSTVLRIAAQRGLSSLVQEFGECRGTTSAVVV
jgi:hypothetical protein